jgi:superfamily II DNA or RNA helicase
MFRKLNLKTNYTSEVDDLYEDFFRPALTEAVSYKRAVAFFSLGVLLNAPMAMSNIIRQKGRIELIFGKLVDAQDFEAIQEGMKQPWVADELPRFERLLEERPGTLLEFRIRVLAWLFSAGQLDMKIAVRAKGMFHQKIGILRDASGDVISFSGSMNETMSALDPRFNSEEITVFQSWNDGQKDYVDNHVRSFEKLWSGETGSSTVICDIPEAIAEGLNFVMKRFPDDPTPEEEAEKLAAFVSDRSGRSTGKPRVPTHVHGAPFSMREHQQNALRAWRENSFNGILELATGSGKTITAIYAATRLIEANQGMALIVAVPYQDLADQWCEELRHFNIHAMRCYGEKAEWEPQLRGYLQRNAYAQLEDIALVVVNKTLKSDHFQSLAQQLDPDRLLFVGDECHHHGAVGFVDKLLPDAKFRLGLSATPFHYLDEEANERLRKVYDRSIFSYSLADAVRDKVLTPYEYIPVPVELTDEETETYLQLTDNIARALAAEKRGDAGKSIKLQSLLMRRARLIGAAENKMVELVRLLEARDVQTHSLFYCSDGQTNAADEDDDQEESSALEQADLAVKQRYAVAAALTKRGVKVSPFTSEENRWQRREILRKFKEGETEALVAIRCLDEGIDVPACRTAYLIASSRNPRQFIQRRGRILRRSPGKERAIIFDFVVVMPRGGVSRENAAAGFLREELKRVADFARHSIYPAASVTPLNPWLEAYGLEHMAS